MWEKGLRSKYLAISTASSHSGKLSILVTRSGTGTNDFSQTHMVEAETTLSLSAPTKRLKHRSCHSGRAATKTVDRFTGHPTTYVTVGHWATRTPNSSRRILTQMSCDSGSLTTTSGRPFLEIRL